ARLCSLTPLHSSVCASSRHPRDLPSFPTRRSSDLTVVYNALPGERSAPTETAAEARRRLGLPDGPLLFTAARLMPLKGIDHTLRALADLPDVRLVVAGEGPARAELEALTAELGLSDRVRFEGFVERDRLPLYFRAADYTLLYSGGEGLSHTLIESLALGTP